MDNLIGIENVRLILDKKNHYIDDLLSSIGIDGIMRLVAALENNMYSVVYQSSGDWSDDMNFEIPLYNTMVKSVAEMYNIPIHVRREVWRCVAQELEHKSPDLKKRIRNGFISVNCDNKFYVDAVTIGDYIYDRMMKFLVLNGCDLSKLYSI